MIKKILLFSTLTLILASLPIRAVAQNVDDHIFLRYYGNAKESFDSIQSVGAGFEFYHTHDRGKSIRWLKYKIEAMVIDDRRRLGTDQDYISGGVGPEFIFEKIYISGFLSAGFLTAKDGHLGGPFQFSQDVNVGFRALESDIRIGLTYKHISSAGLYKPNLGKDLIGLGLFIPF